MKFLLCSVSCEMRKIFFFVSLTPFQKKEHPCQVFAFILFFLSTLLFFTFLTCWTNIPFSRVPTILFCMHKNNIKKFGETLSWEASSDIQSGDVLLVEIVDHYLVSSNERKRSKNITLDEKWVLDVFVLSAIPCPISITFSAWYKKKIGWKKESFLIKFIRYLISTVV